MAVKKSGIGIIVGRFQTLELTALHQKLINSVRRKHVHCVVFLTTNPAPSDYNPLDWEFRAMMFVEHYADEIEVLDMPDLHDDRIWSQELDRRILELRLEGEATIYGSKEDFVDRYSGKFKAVALEPTEKDLEKEVTMSGVTSPRDFRAGILYGMLRRFPTVYPTVDIGLFRNDYTELLLARKPNEAKWRLPGGFVDPSDDSYEQAALRELGEECGELGIRDLGYIGSTRIDDWRYRGSADGIMTHLYACEWMEGEAEPSDDISEVRWFEFDKIRVDMIVEEHRILMEMLQYYLSDEDFDEEDEDDDED